MLGRKGITWWVWSIMIAAILLIAVFAFELNVAKTAADSAGSAGGGAFCDAACSWSSGTIKNLFLGWSKCGC